MPYKDLEKRRECARESNKRLRKIYPERHKAATQKWIKNNREKYLQGKKEWRKKQGIDYWIKQCEDQKIRKAKSRREVIAHYGNKCVCCGVSQYEFLTIEHKNGGGTKHRKLVGPANMIRFIIKSGYPDIFEILCYNCNCSKAYYKICPHKQKISVSMPQ